MIAGPYPENLPKGVRIRINFHFDRCLYHQGIRFIKSALTTPVTEGLEEAALGVVKKYTQ